MTMTRICTCENYRQVHQQEQRGVFSYSEKRAVHYMWNAAQHTGRTVGATFATPAPVHPTLHHYLNFRQEISYQVPSSRFCANDQQLIAVPNAERLQKW